MTKLQKLILAILAIVVVIVFVAFGCFLLVLLQQSTPDPEPALAGAAPAPSPSLQLPTADTVTSVSLPTATPTETALPTPTSTRVVTQTVAPTPTPTPINCIDDIIDFEASGLITSLEVEDYLRATIPLAHLDRCQRIKYIPLTVEQQATPVSGRFIPFFRQISVYPVAGGYRGPAEILDTVTHEVGHNVHYNLRIDNLEVASQWTELHQQDAGFVSDYARTNEYEDFAESYRVYVRQPELLQLYSPVKYEFMRLEVFAGQEYPR